MRLSPSPRRRRGALVLAPVLALAVAATLPGVATAHELDHPAPAFGNSNRPFQYSTSGGQGATWQPVTSIPTGNPHSDLEFFTKNGETYAAVGTLAAGGNQGGQTIVKLTDGGKVQRDDGSAAPVFAAGHPSATCISNPAAALGLQHDVEATPKGATINNDSYLPPVTEDAQLLIDATDQAGRCHDQGTLGISSAPRGGLEIIDITGLGTPGFRPREIALTSHIGESHTVNIDPQRPHIAYSVTSDGVNVTANPDGTFQRRNELPPSAEGAQPNNLDGFEVVDLSSCMFKTAAVPAGTLPESIKALPADQQLAAKRDACRPEVYRYRYESLAISQGHTIKTGIFGCHELKPYPDDKLTCGSGAAAIVFDMAGAFDADGKPRGEKLDCRRRPSSSTAAFQTGAMVTDCVVGTDNKDLRIPAWLADGAPSLAGVKHVGTQTHIGRATGAGFATTIPATEDIDFNHETEFTHSGRFLLATDERGGGVLGGAQCNTPQAPPQANGGVHAYRVDRLRTFPEDARVATAGAERGTPVTRAEADMGYAAPASGQGKSIYRAPVRTGGEATFCTAHVLQQVPEQNRIFMGWYTQGTQVIDYVELPGSKLQFIETGFAIPVEANTWVSHVFQKIENPDGTFTYYGVSGDITRATIDIFKVTMPEPLTPCDLKAGTAERSKPSTVSDRDQARGVHVENVDCVLNYDISQGKTSNADGSPATYAPTERVTRGQMASFIARTLVQSRDDDSVLPAGGDDVFSDIATDTHRVAINRLARAGIVKGLTGPGGRFDPLAPITRAQMASFIVEAARYANEDDYVPTRLNYFGDVPRGDVHERSISAGFEAGLFQGTTAPGEAPRSGLFSPVVQVQRDQMATFLVNLFTQSIR